VTVTTPASAPRALSRRLRAVQVGAVAEGFMLWVPIEKLFQTEIGFDAATIGLMAAAYAAVVPLLEVPTGILADRWSRKGILVVASLAAGASALIGGLSQSVPLYIVAAMVLGIYFALSSGTVDSVVYDTVVEETGSSDLYERWMGRVRIVESVSLAASAVLGGVVAELTSARLTYFLTIPFAVAGVVAYLRFDEPQLHRTEERTALREHVSTTLHAMVAAPRVRTTILLLALTALLSQTVFEFGPLWLVDLQAPPGAYGPYWALLVGTLGVGGYLAGRLDLDRRGLVAVLAAVLVAAAVVLSTSRQLVVVAAAQTALALVLAMLGIHAGRLLHDAVSSRIRAGVSSGAGTLSWLLFLPFSLVFGALARRDGVQTAGWLVVGAVAVLAVLLVVVVARSPRTTPQPEPDPAEVVRADVSGPPPVDLVCEELVTVVSDYLDGVLPADWRERVDDHLSGCDGCSGYLGQLRTMLDRLAELEVQQGRPPQSLM
jgi:MFS family permease